MSAESEQIQKLVEEFKDRLSEHCDSVSIFVTFPSHDGETDTGSLESGGGNYYARLGQVVEWVAMQDQYARNYADRKDEAAP